MPKKAQVIPINFDENTQKLKWKKTSPLILKAAYGYCAAVTENFPVASVILPKNIRPAIHAIYAFSRIADDFADEQEFKNIRMDRLNDWESWLDDDSLPTNPVFIALHDSIKKHKLPKKLFHDLIAAFKMDVVKTRYENFSEILHYCQHSANPVGRLVLNLFDQSSEELLKLSDYICTALQLTNFWQDIAIDLKKNRIYLPQDECDKFDVPIMALFNHTYNTNFKRLMQYQFERTRDIFNSGKPLGLYLKGKLGVEIRLTWLTGATVLKKIRAVNYDVFNSRPTLKKIDFIKLLFTAISRKRYEKFRI